MHFEKNTFVYMSDDGIEWFQVVYSGMVGDKYQDSNFNLWQHCKRNLDDTANSCFEKSRGWRNYDFTD